MNGKIHLALALFAVLAAQLVYSLKCQTCFDLESCQKPATIICDTSSANYSLNILTRYYYDMKIVNSKDFSCFSSTYKAQNGNIAVDVRGCITTGSVDCNSHLIDETVVKDKCAVCKVDNCSKSDAVGFYSFSAMTMLSLFVLTKVFII